MNEGEIECGDAQAAPRRRGLRIERGGFVLFLALITLLLALIVWPFAAALFWATLAAIMFQPLFLKILRRMREGRNRAALLTLLVITFAVVVPALVIGSMIIDQATGIYLAIQDQRLDAGQYFALFHDALPGRARALLDSTGYGDFGTVQTRISELVRESVGLIAVQALAIGGGFLSFVLSFGVGLYATYFLLRDGQQIGAAIRTGLPLEPAIADSLVDRFVAIIRATIKGSIVVGLVQGALGALTFWIAGVPAALLFGLLMAIFSLLPALGPAIVWLPMAIYLLLSGAVWQGLVIIFSGVLVIGMADNVLRPLLVGRDTGIPDWIILVSTLGGIAVMGVTGIVVGPAVAGLFLAGWSILRTQRAAAGEARLPTSTG